jgi:hypothetical protein
VTYFTGNTSNRMMSLVGPNLELVQFEFDRQKFMTATDGSGLDKDAWQDFQFRVLPGSSLASTRVQRGVMAMNLHMAGLLPGEEVLRAAEWPSPAETVQKARQERAQFGPMQPQGRNGKPIRLPGARAGGL